MEKVFLVIVLCVAVEVSCHHPKFPKRCDETPSLKKVACNTENERIRNEIIEKSRCGEPKEVFINLKPQTKNEQVSPGAVWVKRCVGLCEYDSANPNSECVAAETITRHIPIRIFNAKTFKETCSWYPVEEHVSCKCSGAGDDCAPPKVYPYEVESI